MPKKGSFGKFCHVLPSLFLLLLLPFSSLLFSSLEFLLLFSSPRIAATMVSMEERRRSLVLVLGLYMCLYMLAKHVADMQALILQGEWEKFAFFSLLHESLGRRERSIWTQARMFGFVDRLLLGSWTEKDFRSRTRVNFSTFRFLCEKLGPYLKKEDTRFRPTVPV